MRPWAESVDRVLLLREIARLREEKRELVGIIQRFEERVKLVVNREQFPVLKDVPSWRDEAPKAKKAARFRGGIRTYQETRRSREFAMSAETRRMERRTREIEQVLQGIFEAAPAAEEQSDGAAES